MKTHKKMWLLFLILGCSAAVLFTVASASQQQVKKIRALKTARELNRGNQDEGTSAPKRKTLREVGQERDVEVSVPNLEFNVEHGDLQSLAKNSTAIVIGQITDEKASFSESGDFINTYYSVDVQRVLKDTTYATPLRPNDELPAPLTSPLKFVRSGGTVTVNGHRVSAKLKGSEFLKAGKEYVLFLRWSPAFKSYLIAGGSSGAFLVQNKKIKPLGSEPKLKLKHEGADLEAFISELLNSQN